MLLIGSNQIYKVPADKCLAANDQTVAKIFVIQGGQNSTVNFEEGRSGCGGIGFFAGSNGVVIARDLNVVGSYRGWINPKLYNDRKPIYHSLSDPSSSSPRHLWAKAFWSRGKNAHIHVEKVVTTGFYYGYTAEDFGTLYAHSVTASESGDGGFFAYSGGHLIAVDSTAEYSADIARGLGFGFVAETLHYSRPDGQPACGTVDWKNVEYMNCIVERSKAIPRSERSLIEAYDCVSKDNLVGGFFANMAGTIFSRGAKAFNHNYRDGTGKPFIALADGDQRYPNVHPYGRFGASFGFLSQKCSSVTANEAMAFNNDFGFTAIWDAEMGALRSKAWNNHHYGFHSVRKGRIDARFSHSFGSNYQKYAFATDARDSLIRVDGTLTVNDNRNVPSFCVWNLDPCPHYVTPTRTVVEFNLPIYKLTAPPYVGLFFVN